MPDSNSKYLVPKPATPIIGREKEVTELIQLLEEYNLVTITGTGGVGKTRIAVETCERLNTGKRDIIFLSMATLTDASEVIPTLAGVLGITESANRSLKMGVAEVLQNKNSLIVLDNLEHVISAAREISELLENCRGLTILCTSRTPLKIMAEQEFPLQTLPLPSSAKIDLLNQNPSIQLFVSRAKKVNRSFELTPENSDAILAICQNLDGLPLALELAAFRLRVLTPAQLLKKLNKALSILSSPSIDFPERHQTLRNTIDWSYELLNEPERKLFRRLGVFARQFSLDAIEQVCFEDEASRMLSVDQMESLVDKGLVQKIESRFMLLQTIKDFAIEKLVEAGELDYISMKHAEYFYQISILVYEGTQGIQQKERMNLGVLEEANICLALDYLLKEAQKKNEDAREMGLSICGKLWVFWHILGKHLTTREYVTSFFEATDDQSPSSGKCEALFSLHVACFTLGEIEVSKEVAQRSFSMAEVLNDEVEMIKGNLGLGFGNMFSDIEKALLYNEETIRRCRKLGNSYWLGLALWQGGVFNLIPGYLDTAKERYTESFEIFQILNENEGIGISQSGLCMLEFISGNYEKALKLYSETLLAFREVGDRPEEARVLCEIAWTHLANQNTIDALKFAMDSIYAHQELGSDRGVGLSMNALAAIEAVKGWPKKAIQIATAAQLYADQKGVAIELGVNNHGKVYIDDARQKLANSEIEEAEDAGRNCSITDILAMIDYDSVHSADSRARLHHDLFLNRINDVIEENLGDSNFGVRQLCECLSMSQMQIYRKLKQIVSQTPSQYVKQYRLDKGRDLMKQTDKTIAEIAYEVGFSDPNYFSRSFREIFHQTPSQFRKTAGM